MADHPGNGLESVELAALFPPRLKDAVPSDKDLPLTIILHGLLGSANNWRSVIARPDMLAGRYVCALDLRNHGRSQHAATMTYPEMANDIMQFVDEQVRSGVDGRVHLVSYVCTHVCNSACIL